MAFQFRVEQREAGFDATEEVSIHPIADYLDNEETISAYLTAALADPDPDAFLVAVKTVARARGMSQLARD